MLTVKLSIPTELGIRNEHTDLISMIALTIEKLKKSELSCDEILAELLCSLQTLPQNTQVVRDALQCLMSSTDNYWFLMQRIANVLSFGQWSGVKSLTFEVDYYNNNLQKLYEINFPQALVPEKYLCNIMYQIMTLPVNATGVGFVDAPTLLRHVDQTGFDLLQEPISTDQVLGKYPINTELMHEIELFVNKAQLIYYRFQANNQYLALYQDDRIQQQLANQELPYMEFKEQLFGLNRLEVQASYPPLSLRTVFAKNKINVLKPSKLDYELLIRRLAAEGEAADLTTVLTSPVLDVIGLDIDAKSSNGLDALAWADKRKRERPAMAAQYRECISRLADFRLLCLVEQFNASSSASSASRV